MKWSDWIHPPSKPATKPKVAERFARDPTSLSARRRCPADPATCALVHRPGTVRVGPPPRPCTVRAISPPRHCAGDCTSLRRPGCQCSARARAHRSAGPWPLFNSLPRLAPCAPFRRPVLALCAPFRRPGTVRVTPPARLPVQCPAPCASVRRPRAVRAISPPRHCACHKFRYSPGN